MTELIPILEGLPFPSVASLESEVVLCVMFPVPPTPVAGTLFPVDSWSSSVLDRLDQFLQDDENFLGASMSPIWGPAILIERPLKKLVNPASRVYCARVSFENLMLDEAEVADNAIIEGLREISNSCHPDSTVVVPDAPMITLALQGLQISRTSRSFPTFKEAKSLFPLIDWSRNSQIDDLFNLFPMRLDEGVEKLSPEIWSTLRLARQNASVLEVVSRQLFEDPLEQAIRRPEFWSEVFEKYHRRVNSSRRWKEILNHEKTV